jgi:hypothetical protein
LPTPSHKLLQMMAAVLSALGSAQATTPPRTDRPPLGKLIGQLREDSALRARFSLNPRSIFEEGGFDPTPYDLPDQLNGDDIDRFLNNWTGARGPAAGSRAADAVTLVSEDRSQRLPVPANEHPEKPASESPAAAPIDPHAAGGPETMQPPPAPQPGELQAPSDTQRSPNRSPSLGPAPTPIYGPPPGFRTKP